jgi:hypothetical protein
MTQKRNSFATTTGPRRPWRLHLAALCIGLLSISGSQAESRLWMTVGEHRMAVTLADTEAARAFGARLPMTLDMADLNGNEKKFDLPTDLPANASRPGMIRNGDLMLYGANTVVLFYLTFDSPYSYTRLGRVDDPDGLAQALGRGSAKVRFSRE